MPLVVMRGNKPENGIWTYSLEDIWKGTARQLPKMAAEVFENLWRESYDNRVDWAQCNDARLSSI